MKRLGVSLILFSCLSFIFCCGTATAQSSTQRLQISIDWSGDLPVIRDNRNQGGSTVDIVREEGKAPALAIVFPLGSNSLFETVISSVSWKDNIGFDGDLSEYLFSDIATASRRKEGIFMLPLAFEDRSFIASIDIRIYTRNAPLRAEGRNTAANSVLASGSWYKFGIPSTGVYALSYEFLQSLGIDPGSIQNNQWRIYGQQGGMLPQLAGIDRVDDLREIPIQIVSGGSTMGPGDYILFYGEGPDMWTFNESKGRFEHSKHDYSDYKGYFITASLGPGARVAQVNPPPGVASATYSTFDDHKFLEEDLFNLNKSGSDWMGDEFSLSLNKSYSFDFPDISASQPVIIDYRVAARSVSGTSSFTLSSGGTGISSVNVSPVGGQYTANAANSATSSVAITTGSSPVTLQLSFNQPNFSARGWIDYIAANATRNLNYSGSPLAFRKADARNQGLVQYNLTGMNSGVQVWDVTDMFDIRSINYSLNGNVASFKAEGGEIRQYVAFSSTSGAPIAFGPVGNQNLHGLESVDYLLLTRQAFVNYADELGRFHSEKEGYSYHVVTLDKIYNEFSSGNPDLTAIRDFLKMFYDRSDDYPKYVCIFGDGTFNNRDLGDYLMPAYQGPNTLTTLATLVSDDYFVFLDDDEGDNIDNVSYKLDMSIGRIPADNPSKAAIAVQKIKKYYEASGYGSWRNVGAFIADDEDLNIHIDDGEFIANQFIADNPVMNIEKIYLDAFRQEVGAGGGLYPDVNRAINNRIFKGALFLNYIGHGGGNGLADERIVTLADIDSWENTDKMPLIISATCEFTRYDDIERYSAGERAFFKADGGAIALVTTVRLVFSNKNFEMNREFMDAMELGLTDESLTLGDIIRIAKNNTLTGGGNRKFTLIGDPALRLAFPEHAVQTTTVQQAPYVPGNDTLKALTLVTIEGEVTSDDGQLLTDFNGLVYPTVYDKVKTLFTLGNDERSNIIPFETQNSILYAGKVQAQAGRFTFSFVVPKDIVYTVGDGKISYYAHDGNRDAAGIDTVLIGGGGSLDSASVDNDAPQVDVFMNDETFISGDFTDDSPDLLVKLFDENGINTVGSGIGHDIVAVLDEDTGNGIVLNDFYESELDSYKAGTIRYPLEDIEPGVHSVTVKAWDVYNNSGEGYTEFVVAESADLALEHVLNYPNPFTTSTTFMFEHNRKGDVLDVRIEIFTVSGRIVKTLQETALSSERRVELPWDGLDEYGDKIGKGVYIYRVTMKDSAGERTEAFQKLVLLR